MQASGFGSRVVSSKNDGQRIPLDIVPADHEIQFTDTSAGIVQHLESAVQPGYYTWYWNSAIPALALRIQCNSAKLIQHVWRRFVHKRERCKHSSIDGKICAGSA